MNVDNYYYEEDRSMAEADLELAIEYMDHPERLTMDDYRNIRDSFRWCYTNNEEKMVVQLAYHLRHFFEQRGRWDEGVFCIQHSLDVCDSASNPLMYTHLCFSLGLLLERQGFLTKAEKQYVLTIKEAQLLDQKNLWADGMHRLGWLHHSRQNFVEAESNYLEAKAIREELRDELAVSRSWHQLGILAQDQGDYEKAQVYHGKALTLREKAVSEGRLEARNLKAASLYELGFLATLQGYWQTAQDKFEETRIIRTELHDEVGLGDVLDQLGSMAYRQGDWEKAYKEYKDCFDIKWRMQDYRGVVRVKLHLAEVCLKQDQFERVLDFLHDCLNITTQKGLQDAHLKSQIHTLLGQALFWFKPSTTNKPDYAAAISHYKTGLQLLDKLGNKKEKQAGILYQIGLSYFEWGYQSFELGRLSEAKQHWLSAKNHYLQCLELREQMDSPLETATTLLQLGKVNQALGEYDQAETHYQKSHDLYVNVKPKKNNGPAQALHRLGNIYHVTNRHLQALESYEQALHLIKLPDPSAISELKKLLNEAKSKIATPEFHNLGREISCQVNRLIQEEIV